jgi:hypothetical protein
MDLDHSTHVNDAQILNIAPDDFADSFSSSGLGRYRVRFRRRGSTLGWIVP